jgi:hypothetical protein
VKIPRDLAGQLIADCDDRFCRVKFKLPLEEARLRAKREFKFFPADTYLTEIDHWREIPDGLVEFSVRRLRRLRLDPN